MKLKTLKDLKPIIHEAHAKSEENFINIEVLKQEAIKWVFEWTKASVLYFKSHNKMLKSLGVNIWRDGQVHRIILTKEVIEYIKFYNNITEDDLK